MLIPKLVPYLPDELIDSWLYRLAEANCLGHSLFISRYFDGNIYDGLFDNLSMLGCDDVLEAIRDTTVYGYESMIMRAEHQSRLMYRYSGRADLGGQHVGYEYRVCPECIAEDEADYGTAYIHRSHCLTGIYNCYKHGLKLGKMADSGQKWVHLGFDRIAIGRTECTDAERRIAIFAKALAGLDAGLDLQMLREIVKLRVRDLYGEGATWQDIPFEDYPYYDLLVPEDKQKLRLKLRGFRNLRMRYMIVVLTCLFDSDIDSFQKYAKKYSCGSNLGIGRYICGRCGMGYYQNQWGADIIGCPKCVGKKEDALLRGLICRACNGEYEPVDTPLSVNQRTGFKHICGRKLMLRPSSLIFDGSRCRCRQHVSFEEAAKRVRSAGDYELVEYAGTEAKVVIKANICGHSFSVLLHKFVQSPYCRLCNEEQKLDEERFIAKVKELAGDEFTVVGSFSGADKRISIRHNLCGKEHSYLPYLFLKNRRCAECSKNISLARLNGLLIDMYRCRYLVIKKDGKYIIRDNTEGTDTPCRISEVYNDLCKGRYVAKNRADELYGYLRKRYKPTDFFYGKYLGRQYPSDYKQLLSKLKKSGKIKGVMLGLYTFADNDYTADDVIRFLYIERYEKRIGYIAGDKDGVIDIVTTMKKSARVTMKEVLGQKIRLYSWDLVENAKDI